MITLVTTFQRRCLQILSHKPPHQQEGRPGTHPQTCFHSPTGEQDAFLIIEKSPIPYQAKNFDLIFPFSLRQVPFPVATVPENFIFWCIDSEQTIKLIWHQWWWKPVSILPEHRPKAFLDPSNPGTRVVLCVWNLQELRGTCLLIFFFISLFVCWIGIGHILAWFFFAHLLNASLI